MSLLINIHQVTNIKVQGRSTIEQKISLAVKNSKSGALLVSKLRFNRIQWPDKYRFTTSMQQNVEFILIRGEQKQAQIQQNIIGRGKLYTKKFAKQYKSMIEQREKNNEPFQYQITLFGNGKKNNINSSKIDKNKSGIRKSESKFREMAYQEEEEVVVGVVKVQIEMDPYKVHEGEIITSVDLDLRGELKANPKYVKFYLGQTKKMNIFNIFDEKVKDTKFRFIESIYRDFQ